MIYIFFVRRLQMMHFRYFIWHSSLYVIIYVHFEITFKGIFYKSVLLKAISSKENVGFSPKENRTRNLQIYWRNGFANHIFARKSLIWLSVFLKTNFHCGVILFLPAVFTLWYYFAHKSWKYWENIHNLKCGYSHYPQLYSPM